jgi:predicted aspartyl protease
MKSLRWIVVASLCLALAPATFAACKIRQVGEIPVRVDGNRVLIDAQINGMDAKVMVDTGAAMTFLWQDAAARLGLALETTSGTRLFGVGGEARLLGTMVQHFQMGSFIGKQMHLAVVGTREGERRPASDMVLGDDFFSHFSTEFDLAHGVIRLLLTDGCKTEQLPYWASAYSLAELERLNPDHPRIQATVLVNGKRVTAILDSGAHTSIIARQTAESIGAAPGQAGTTAAGTVSGIAARPIESWVGTFATFAIGDEAMRNVQLQIADLFSADTTEELGSRIHRPLEDSPSMLVGCDFFLSHRILVLAKEHTLLFTYNGGPVFQLVKTVAAPKDDTDPIKESVPAQTAPAAAH